MDIFQMTAHTPAGEQVMAGKITLPNVFNGNDTNTCRQLLYHLDELGYLDCVDVDLKIDWPDKNAFLVFDRGVVILEGQAVGSF